jgi:hypothetical protein
MWLSRGVIGFSCLHDGDGLGNTKTCMLVLSVEWGKRFANSLNTPGILRHISQLGSDLQSCHSLVLISLRWAYQEVVNVGACILAVSPAAECQDCFI